MNVIQCMTMFGLEVIKQALTFQDFVTGFVSKGASRLLVFVFVLRLLCLR
jgi:hypothetical protein